jgi:nucleoside-diphosphate-sugar epimerase
MKILVTGGTGFTGSHLTRRLLQRGHKVTAIDNQPGLFADELRSLGAEILLGSVTDRQLVDTAARGCQVIYHVAAAFRKVNLPRKVYWDVNVGGTRNVLDAALKHGVDKVVYCSTCGVHGDVKQDAGDEDAPIAPEDYYQYTKYEGERVVQEFVQKGLRTVILRPAAIYGPGDPARFYNLFKLIKKGRFLMFGPGEVRYHPLYIDNLLNAFELAAEFNNGNGEAYLIADAKAYSLNQLVSAIAEALGVDLTIQHYPFWPLWVAAVACEIAYKPLPMDPPLFRRRVDWFRQNRAFNISKARRDLGYRPEVDLKEGLAMTADWYLSSGYLQ